jgi:hypothetical protein
MLETATIVNARMNYLAPGERAPRSYIDPPAPGAEVRRPETVIEEVAIRDARPILQDLSLDREGLALVRQPSRVPDFYDADEVRAVYYPEVAALVEEVTGAARVHVFDHNIRSEPRADRGEAKVRKPVRFVHNDDTETSGPQRVRDLLPDEAEVLLGRRFAVINVWRPIVGPVEDTPLAVCDATSMGDGDFVATDLVYEDRVGEVYSVRHSPTHRWYYVSAMRPDEAMLLKCYDSETDGRARFTAHSAFRNPTAPADAIPRESIEARTLAFF